MKKLIKALCFFLSYLIISTACSTTILSTPTPRIIKTSEEQIFSTATINDSFAVLHSERRTTMCRLQEAVLNAPIAVRRPIWELSKS
jgi:hypothetical protein